MATPASPLSSAVSSAESKVTTWFLHHAILLLIVGGLTIAGIYGVESIVARHDAANDSKWQAILATQTQKTDEIQKQLTSDETNWNQVISQLTAQNSQLAAAIVARDKAAQQQQKVDATLDAQGVAGRINADVPHGEAVAQNNDIVLPLDTGRGVAGQLDLLPSVQADLANAKTQLANETQIATDSQKDVAEQKTLVASQQKQLSDETAACQAQVKALNAKHRKSLLKTLGIGIGIGIGLGAHFI